MKHMSQGHVREKKIVWNAEKKGFILSYMTKQIIAYLLLEMRTSELSTFVCSSRMHCLDRLGS